MTRVKPPAPVADLYRAIEKLKKTYGRKFTLDGHALDSTGEVVAQEVFGFKLLPMSALAHDSVCKIRGEFAVIGDERGSQAMNRWTVATRSISLTSSSVECAKSHFRALFRARQALGAQNETSESLPGSHPKARDGEGLYQPTHPEPP
jgi:hypothetical protein